MNLQKDILLFHKIIFFSKTNEAQASIHLLYNEVLCQMQSYIKYIVVKKAFVNLWMVVFTEVLKSEKIN